MIKNMALIMALFLVVTYLVLGIFLSIETGNYLMVIYGIFGTAIALVLYAYKNRISDKAFLMWYIIFSLTYMLPPIIVAILFAANLPMK